MKQIVITGVMNLLKVKSVVTILLTIVFCILAIQRVISGEQFLTIFSVVIAFYFGTQAQKAADIKEDVADETN